MMIHARLDGYLLEFTRHLDKTCDRGCQRKIHGRVAGGIRADNCWQFSFPPGKGDRIDISAYPAFNHTQEESFDFLLG
jgi:hypothetical protein